MKIPTWSFISLNACHQPFFVSYNLKRGPNRASTCKNRSTLRWCRRRHANLNLSIPPQPLQTWCQTVEIQQRFETDCRWHRTANCQNSHDQEYRHASEYRPAQLAQFSFFHHSSPDSFIQIVWKETRLIEIFRSIHKNRCFIAYLYYPAAKYNKRLEIENNVQLPTRQTFSF
jgi:hypothetical protein